MAQCLVARLRRSIEPSRWRTAPVAKSGHPPHTPYPDLPVVFPQNNDRSLFGLFPFLAKTDYPLSKQVLKPLRKILTAKGNLFLS